MITTPSTQSAGDRREEPLTLRLGHPVRNFVLVLLVLAAPLAAAWWTGAVTPRLELRSALMRFDRCTRKATFSFDIVNPTPSQLTSEP